MTIDKKAFVEKYVLENEDILKRVGEHVLFLEKYPGDTGTVSEIMRCFHTIKGTSRMMGFSQMSELAHKSEDIIAGLSRNKIPFSTETADFMIKLGEVMKASLREIKEGRTPELGALLDDLTAVIEKERFKDLSAVRFPSLGYGCADETAPVALDRNAIESDMVRIKTDRLDSVLKDVNEVMIHYLSIKNTTVKLASTIQRLKAVTGGEKGESEELFQQLHQVYKGFRDHLGKMDLYISQIQGALFDLKMLPISIVFEQLPGAARDIARQLKKRVDVVIESQNSFLDKTIIEKIDEPIIHILRNAIAHGIEQPDERRAKRKSETGRITIRSYMESGNAVIRIADDGRGIDIRKIKKRARDKGIQAAELDMMSEEEAANLIFHPGISTAETVDDVSGRGVGMDIVKRSIEDLKGTVSLKSNRDEGTEFIIMLPLTLSTMSVLFVLYQGVIFAVPLAYIEIILRVSKSTMLSMADCRAVKHGSDLVTVADLGEIMNMPRGGDEKYKYILVLKSIDARMGVMIEDILGESEIVIKPLPHHLKKIRSIMGVTINNINEISNIIHVPSIIQRYGISRKGASFRSEEPAGEDKKAVLVVDDSESMRDFLRTMLERGGYLVAEAENGREALEILRSGHYDMVLSDISMPVMDGLSLLQSVRADDIIKQVPFVIVSSLRDQETVKKARDLGASRYLVKDRFKSETLLDLVGKLTA